MWVDFRPAQQRRMNAVRQWTTRLAWAIGVAALALGPVSVSAQERTKAPAKTSEPAKAGNSTRPTEAAERAKADAPLKGEDVLMKAEAHYELGVMHHERMFESLDQAIAEYEKAILLKPEYAEAHFNLGLSYHTKAKLGIDDQKLYRKAIDEYKLYLKHSPQGEWAEKAKQNIRAVEARLQGGAPTKSR
jgi:tetratricopeptide (TPR) repeat protein